MKRLNSLYAKLALGLVAVLIVVALFYMLTSVVIVRYLGQSIQQNLHQNLAQSLVDDKRIVHDGRVDSDAMKAAFMEYMAINPSIEIYHLDPQGKILSYSAEPGLVKRNGVSLKPIQEFLSEDPTFPLLGDDPRSHEIGKPFSVTPIPDRDNLQGYLYVVLQGGEYTSVFDAEVKEYTLSLARIFLPVSLLPGLLIGLFIFKKLTQRLGLLEEKVTDFAQSDFRKPEIFVDSGSDDRSADEISHLENRISQMSQHISKQWAALKKQDLQRREMIGSISHDLHTPLALIKGYLETIILKQGSLGDEEKDRYLKIAIKQAHRLQKLIAQLVELEKLEAHETQPKFEIFSILELTYDVVQKFSLETEKKEIHLNIDENSVNTRVVADIGLIERVLDNLLGNALQHTPRHGAIEIKINSGKENRVYILVSDNGPGIPSSQQKMIFERFYQADNPQRSGGQAGLGLAIVKRIIDLHQQKLWVESEPELGARFIFTLDIE